MATKLHYTLPAGFKHVTRVRSHVKLAAFYHGEVYDDIVGTIPRPEGIPSPYAYSREWPVYRTREGEKYVIVRETAQRCFDVIEVPTELVTLD